nr:hypothetical protein Iba_chr11dCG10380 [Ipomoea batatas]
MTNPKWAITFRPIIIFNDARRRSLNALAVLRLRRFRHFATSRLRIRLYAKNATLTARLSSRRQQRAANPSIHCSLSFGDERDGEVSKAVSTNQ